MVARNESRYPALAARLLANVGVALASLAAAAAMAQDHAMHAKSRPALAVGVNLDAAGRLWLARVEKQQLLVSHSADGGRTFSAPVAATPEPEAVLAEGENRPKIDVDADGRVYLTWTQGLGKPMTGNIRFARSTDAGLSFSAPVTLNDDRQEISHRFDALASDGQGGVAVVWLDARERSGKQAKGSPATGVSLYAAISRDGGASFGPNRRIAPHSCQCCRTGLVWTQNGPKAYWRHVFGENIRDFALAGLDASAPARITDDEWQIDGCPHHGGTLAAGADGTLHLTWFTNGKRRQGAFYRRIAGDGQLGEPMALGSAARHAEHPAVAAHGRRVLLAWREFDGKTFSAWAQLSLDGGSSWGEPRRLAESVQATDYVQPLIGAHQALLVWNTAAEGLRILPVSADLP